MKLIIFFIIIFSQSVLGQNVFCGYDQLHSSKTRVGFSTIRLNKKITNEYDSTNIYSDSNVVHLNRKYKIKHKYPSLTAKLTSNAVWCDSIEVLQHKFCLQSIVSDSLLTDTEIKKAIKVRFLKSTFLILEGSYDREKKLNFSKRWVLVFDISNKREPRLIKNPPTGSTVFAFSSTYFGDFDNNNLLDFVFFNSHKLRLYSIKDGRFVESPFFVEIDIESQMKINDYLWITDTLPTCTTEIRTKRTNKMSTFYK